jgi:hypothetical protein
MRSSAPRIEASEGTTTAYRVSPKNFFIIMD